MDAVPIFLWLAGSLSMVMALFHLILGGFLGSSSRGTQVKSRGAFSFRASLNPILSIHFFLSAWIVLLFREELLGNTLGTILLAVMAAFWWIRALDQWMIFGFKSGPGNLLGVVFVAGGWLHLAPVLMRWG